MNPLNDDELNALLQQAKATPLKPSPKLAARTLSAWREHTARPPFWRRSISLRWRVGALAALLILAGTLGTQAFGPSSDVGLEGPVMPQRANPHATDLTLKDLQPIQEIKPRVVRSMKDDQ
jgi:hypothetical protein